MAKVAKNKDVYLAQKIEFKTLTELLKGFLSAVGKPFYLILSYLILGFLFVCYSLGHFLRVFVSFFLNILLKVPDSVLKTLAKPKIVFPTPRLPKPPSLPRFPEVGTSLRLLFLRGLLFITKRAKYIPQPRISFRTFILVFLLASLIYGFWSKILKDLPSPRELTTRNIEVSTKIYDRNGVLLYKIYKNKNRTIVPLSKIPQQVRLATLAAEDAEFYGHPGFSVRGIFRSLVRNIQRGEITGGSTITQQLVKNALLSPEKTVTRKIKEIILSVEVELTYSKDAILEMYLNEVSYGSTAYGIEEASQLYFGKNVDQLDVSEAALLAGLPKSPTKFSPFGGNPDLALVRQKEVLRLMRINGFISKDEEQKAGDEKLSLAPNRTEMKAPHFVMYVRDALVDKYGEEMVEKGGLEVTTTLDYGIQKMAEEVVSQEIDKLTNFHVGNGAALVLTPKTGEILAMVGSKDYFDIRAGGNVNVTTRLRQPGSSIKVVNYAHALSHDYTPATILDDSPVTFATAGSPLYSPKNYDGEFRGRLPLRNALAESRNVPAVKVLASYGVANMIELGRRMGITTWDDPSRFGLSLTLGGGDVKLIDLARVYATIANLGEKPNMTSMLKVTNYKGETLEENGCISNSLIPISYAAEAQYDSCEKEGVLDPRVAYLLIDILKDNGARAPEFGINSALVIRNHPEVAAKTGTSNDLKDNLTLGFNQKYLVAVWVGNNDSTPMARIASGITGAAPIWNKIMTSLLAGEESVDWQVPDGLVHVSVCPLTGTLPCEGCPGRPEWFLREKAPTKACVYKPPETSINGGQIIEPAAHYP